MHDDLISEYEKAKNKLEYDTAKEKLDNSLRLYRFAVSNWLTSEIIFVHQRVKKRQIEFEKAVFNMAKSK